MSPAKTKPRTPRKKADAPRRSRRRTREIGVGLIGLGFMGRTHLAAYRSAARVGLPNKLLAVCDQDLARLGGKAFQLGNLEARGTRPFLDLSALTTYGRPEELLAHPGIELVSICTPTPTHVPLALAALAAGKHVLIEKPVALAARDVARLATAARKSGRLCMPAMCMRFWPGWTWLQEAIASGRYGKVRSAVFTRLGTAPNWSQGFYSDPRKSGGALFDLHVHDADFVRWCFGAPESVVSTGTADHVTTLYRYPRGPAHVVAEGGWDHTPGFPFFMGFNVVFEQATVEYALGRSPALTLTRAGKTVGVAVEPGTGYDGEIRHALSVLRGKEEPRATIEEAVDLVRMLEAEKKSLASGRPVKPGPATRR